MLWLAALALMPADDPLPVQLTAEVRAGAFLVDNGLQALVPAGGARLLIGPRDVDAAVGFAVDFDGQSAFLSTGDRWSAATALVRLEGQTGLAWTGFLGGDVDLVGGAGVRLTQHSAAGPGIGKELLVVGATARIAPELTFDGGPGFFTVSLPIDASWDASTDVRNFAPFAVGLFLGYRLVL